jgi:2-polyprenyl-3-methyl-5-hydroxy-6-metoxy-1,4-benzoquinol methylase
MSKWKEAQEFEKDWWGDCGNTVWEDVKQMNLAPYLGLKIVPNEYTNYRIPLNGESVLDIGGGPSSLLLKCENVHGTVVDPCKYPEWVALRYEQTGIDYIQMKAEDYTYPKDYDCIWIYNCLQHTDNPKKIVTEALKHCKLLRMFEWIEIGTNKGHPHSLTREQLEGWLGAKGKVTKLSGGGLYGQAFSGVFLGKNYGSKAKKI